MLNKKVKYSDVCFHRKSGDNHTAMTVSKRTTRLSDVYVNIMVIFRQTVLTSYTSNSLAARTMHSFANQYKSEVFAYVPLIES